MKPKKKNDKPINKWKIAAIISMAINFLVAVLLAVGLAQPKTEKTSAYSNGDYAIYTSKRTIDYENDPLSIELFHSNVYNSYSSGNSQYLDYSFSENGHPFIIGNETYDYISLIQLKFSIFPTISLSNYYLSAVYFAPTTPSPSGDVRYLVLSISWDWNSTHDAPIYSYSYLPLGIYSDYVFIPYSLPEGFLMDMDLLFTNLGSNEIVSDYLITDNFNPNKYISIASDSIGTLYDPPSAYSNATSGVKWSNPIYRGVINGAYYSTLGFLEIPLLFTSGGENFIGIRLYYDVVRTYIDKNNEWQVIDYGNSQQLHEFHYTFVYMSYVYELSTSIGQAYTTWREKVVSAVPVYRIYNNYVDNNVEYRNYCYYLFEPYKWLSEDYKTISVYQASSEQLQKIGIDENISRSRFAINGLTIEQILQYDMRQEKDGVGTSNYIGNVFIVIKDAFASLMPLLSLTIIPGITIGMLMFLPLVLIIIIVVIKLVKR